MLSVDSVVVKNHPGAVCILREARAKYIVQPTYLVRVVVVFF